MRGSCLRCPRCHWTFDLDAITAPPLRLAESDINNVIVVRHDKLWDRPLVALAIGAGIGTALELADGGGNQKFQGGGVVGLASLCAVVGLVFDFVNRDTVTVYVQKSRI